MAHCKMWFRFFGTGGEWRVTSVFLLALVVLALTGTSISFHFTLRVGQKTVQPVRKIVWNGRNFGFGEENVKMVAIDGRQALKTVAKRDSKAAVDWIEIAEEGGEGVIKDQRTERGAESSDMPVRRGTRGALDSCRGHYVYMYDLPSNFNDDFLGNCSSIHKWVDMCPAFSNEGAGELSTLEPCTPAPPENQSMSSPDDNLCSPGHLNASDVTLLPQGSWFETDQFSLEVIFHARMKQYSCLTDDPAKATIFFIPNYANLAIFRSLYEADVEERDRPARELVTWLEAQPSWHRWQGRDHFMVLGRVVWDFVREIEPTEWGTSLLSLSYMRNVTTVSIEGSPYDKHGDVWGVPYPTSFHPTTDQDVLTWQAYVRSYPRQRLVVYAGRDHGMGGKIREALFRLCQSASPECNAVHCGKRRCMKAVGLAEMYLAAHFCLQPPGDTPTRKALFDCMIMGGIPVVFNADTSYTQYFWHLTRDPKQYSIFISEESFWRSNGSVVMEVLKGIPESRIAVLRKNVIGLIPQLVYATPQNSLATFRDSFNVTLRAVLNKVKKMKHLARKKKGAVGGGGGTGVANGAEVVGRVAEEADGKQVEKERRKKLGVGGALGVEKERVREMVAGESQAAAGTVGMAGMGVVKGGEREIGVVRDT